jgi:hypothetical protein
MPKTPFSTKLIGEFSLTAASPDSSFVREGKLYFQLRDRFGRWIYMGQTVKFKVRLPNGQYHSVIGTSSGKGHSDGVRGLITVENDAYLPNGNYPVDSANLQQYVALLSDKDLKDQGIELGKDVSGNTVTAREDSAIPNLDDIISEAEEVSSPAKELLPNITGNEIQNKKISSIAKALKAEGRFPIPRESSTDTWGKTSDVTKGAKLDYAKVYEGMSSENPEFAENYPTFDEFWKRVVNLSVDDKDQSPNDLNNILQEMKDINKGYAKHVLGLDPDNGTFTVYRNAINNKSTQEESAVGYVTTNENFAWDYNATTRVGEAENGRYEITVKPDEVFGMIGYSQVEDEYGLTIGRGVTYQEGRVKKVGELESPYIAPWYDEALAQVPRKQGATPFRHHSLVGQYDFLPVSKNPMPGDTIQEFLDANNMTVEDFRNKFDEVNGEGAYQRYKDSGNTVDYRRMQQMVVDLGNGTYGIDITKIDPTGQNYAGSGSYGDTSDPSSFVNDPVDNRLKFLSLFQEILGEPFMVHKNHSKSDPRLEDNVELEQPEPAQEATKKPIVVSELPEVENLTKTDISSIEIDKLYDTTSQEEFAVYEYQGINYAIINRFARNFPNYTKSRDTLDPNEVSVFYNNEYIMDNIDLIDNAIGSHELRQEVNVYRGTTLSKDRFDELLANLDVGDIALDAGYLSTSTNPRIAVKFATRKLNDEPDRIAVLYKGKLSPNQQALRVSDLTQTDNLSEDEMLLPRNTKFKVTKISKLTGDGEVSRGLGEQAGYGKIPLFDEAKEIVVFEGEYVQETETQSLADINLGDLDPADRTFDDELQTLTTEADLTEEQIEALRQYTGENWHTKVNNYLRNGYASGFTFEEGKLEETREKLEAELEKIIKPLDEAINSTTLLEDTVLYRGTSAFDGGGEFGRSPEEILDNLENNRTTEIIDMGFTSTSYDPEVAEWFGEAQASSNPFNESSNTENSIIVYRINAKKGQKAYQVTGGSAAGRDEKELILPRNTKFKVSGYTHNKSDPDDPETYAKFIIDLEIAEPATPTQVEPDKIPLWSPDYGNKIPTLYHGSGVNFQVGDIIDYTAEWNPAKMAGVFSEEQDELAEIGYATKDVLYQDFVFASDSFDYAADYAHTPRINQFEEPEDGFVYEVEPVDPTTLKHLMPSEIGSPVGYRIVKKMDKNGVEISPTVSPEAEPATPTKDKPQAPEWKPLIREVFGKYGRVQEGDFVKRGPEGKVIYRIERIDDKGGIFLSLNGVGLEKAKSNDFVKVDAPDEAPEWKPLIREVFGKYGSVTEGDLVTRGPEGKVIYRIERIDDKGGIFLSLNGIGVEKTNSRDFVKVDLEVPETDNVPVYKFENNQTGWKYSDEHIVGTGGKDRPTDEELDAIETYIGKGYSQMNDVTRGYDPGDDPFSKEEIATHVENLTNLIDRNPPLGTTALVYRGVYDSVGMKYSELEVGSKFVDDGFVSTTASVPTARGFGNIQLEIELGEDSKLIDVSETVEGTRVPVKEAEIILQRGTAFEVLAKTENGFRLRVVESDFQTEDQTEAITDGTNTIKDKKGNAIAPGQEVEILYSIYEVGKGSRNAEEPLKAIFTGYTASDFTGGRKIGTAYDAIVYVEEQSGVKSGYYTVNRNVLNLDSEGLSSLGGISPTDIDEFSKKNALPSPKQMTKLSEEEAEEISNYTSHKGSHGEINSSLRDGSVSPETKEKIEVLDRIIGYNQILEDQDYYRGVPIPLGLTIKEFLSSLDSGEITELDELGFSSTSTEEKMASIFANKYFGGGVVLRIKAKAGQTAYYVPNFLAGVVANENEVILPRGIKYRIISHEFFSEDDKVVIDVEIV